MKKYKSVMAAAVVWLSLLASCKTKERIVTIGTVRTDTTYITRHERDSIHEHDSIHVSEKQRGDTIFVEVERVRRIYIDKTKHDTIYISKTDSVPRPYPVEVKVPAPLSWWQQTRLHLANIVLCALGLWVVVKLWKRC